MFGRLTGMLKVSEAGVIVKRAFRALPLPMLPFDPDELGTKLVAVSYNSKPELFDGKHGKPPHPVAMAAASLADGLTSEDYEFAHVTQKCIFYALGHVLLDATANAHRYGLKALDMRILELSEAAYLENRPRFEAEATAIVGGLGV